MQSNEIVYPDFKEAFCPAVIILEIYQQKAVNTSCDIDDTATCCEIPQLLGNNEFYNPSSDCGLGYFCLIPRKFVKVSDKNVLLHFHQQMAKRRRIGGSLAAIIRFSQRGLKFLVKWMRIIEQLLKI